MKLVITITAREFGILDGMVLTSEVDDEDAAQLVVDSLQNGVTLTTSEYVVSAMLEGKPITPYDASKRVIVG